MTVTKDEESFPKTMDLKKYLSDNALHKKKAFVFT